MDMEMAPTPILTGADSLRFKRILRENSQKNVPLIPTPGNQEFIRRILKDQGEAAATNTRSSRCRRGTAER